MVAESAISTDVATTSLEASSHAEPTLETPLEAPSAPSTEPVIAQAIEPAAEADLKQPSEIVNPPESST